MHVVTGSEAAFRQIAGVKVTRVLPVERRDMMVTEIPTDLAPFVQRLVAERRFLSEGDVVAEALRLLQSREELRQQVRLGFNQLDARQVVPAEEAYARAEQRIEEIEAEANAQRTCHR
jgi:antitoxin ParD1/3/4